MPLETHYSSYSTASLGRYNRDSKTRWRTISPATSSGVGSSNLFISSRAVSGVDIDNVYGFSRSSPLSFDQRHESSISTSHPNSKYVSRLSPAYARESRTQEYSTAVHKRQSPSTSKRILPDRNLMPSHRFESSDSARFVSGAESVRSQFNEDRSYYPCSRKSKAFTRSVTTDLGTDLSLINSSYSYHRNVSSHLSHETTFRRNYRPIFIERPSITNFVPRPSEGKLKLPTRAVRRDRPLVKFLEREDLNPDKVRNLLNAWARGRHVEGKPAEDESENRKRDSVQSDDSGIGSFRNSRRSRQKSGEFGHETSIKCDDDGGNYLHKGVEEGSKLINIAAADEGVHFETEDSYQVLLPGKEFQESVKNSTYSSKKLAEYAVEKIDPNTGEQIFDAAPNVLQNKRRVRINANENSISSQTKDESADENNNKLSSQNLNNGESPKCSTPADASVLKCDSINAESALTREQKTKNETVLINRSILPEFSNATHKTLADTKYSLTDDFKERPKGKGEKNISIESTIRCIKDESADLPLQINDKKIVFTELSKYNQSEQTVINKECNESKEQQDKKEKAIASNILLSKTSDKTEQECLPKSLDVKKERKMKNLDADRKKIKPKILKGDDITKSSKYSTTLSIATNNDKESLSLNSKAPEEQKSSRFIHESGTPHVTEKALSKISTVEENSNFELKTKLVKNVDILTEPVELITIAPENMINLKEKELMSIRKNKSNGTEFNSNIKLRKKEKVDVSEKLCFKEKNEVLVEAVQQKTVISEVEKNALLNKLKEEAPIANKIANSLIKEPASTIRISDKTDIQPASVCAKKKCVKAKNEILADAEQKKAVFSEEEKKAHGNNLKQKDIPIADKSSNSLVKESASKTCIPGKTYAKPSSACTKKKGFKEKNEISVDTAQQKPVSTEVEKKALENDLKKEDTPVANKISNCLVKESASKTCIPDKTDVQPSSACTKKKGFKEKNEILVDANQQKPVSTEVEKKALENNLKKEDTPVANKISNSLVKESASKTCIPEKTDVQPSSVGTEKKYLRDTDKLVKQFACGQRTVNVQKSQSDDFPIHANKCGNKKICEPSRKSSFGEYSSVSKELIKSDIAEKTLETKNVTKESVCKYDNITHFSNVRRSTIGEYPACNSNKVLYKLQKSFSTDSKSIMKELSASHASHHSQNFLTAQANKVRISSITEGKSESLKTIPTKSSFSLRETSKIFCQKICSDETLLPMNVGNVIAISKENNQTAAGIFELKSETDSSSFKNDNKTDSENCKKGKQAALLNANSIAKGKINSKTTFASGNSELSKIVSSHTMDKVQVGENARSEELCRSLNEMKIENKTTVSGTRDVKNSFVEFEKEFQSCKTNIQQAVSAANNKVESTLSIQNLQENDDSPFENNTTSMNSKVSKDAQFANMKSETDAVKMAPRLTKCSKKLFTKTNPTSDSEEQTPVISKQIETRIISSNDRTQKNVGIVPNNKKSLISTCKADNEAQVTSLKSKSERAKSTSQITECEKTFFGEKVLSLTGTEVSLIAQETENNHLQIRNASDGTQEIIALNKSKVLNATCKVAEEMQVTNVKSETEIDKMAPSQLPKCGKTFPTKNKLAFRTAEQISITPHTTEGCSEVLNKQVSALPATSIKNMKDVPDKSDSNAACKHENDMSKTKASCFPEVTRCIMHVRDDREIPENKKAPDDKTTRENNFITKQVKIPVTSLEQQVENRHHSIKTDSIHDNIESSSCNILKEGVETKSASPFADTESLLQEDALFLKSYLTDKGISDCNELKTEFNNETSNAPKEICDSNNVQLLIPLNSREQRSIEHSNKELSIVQNECIRTKSSEAAIENRKDSISSNEKGEDVLFQNQAGHSNNEAFYKPINVPENNTKENEPKSNVVNLVLHQAEDLKTPFNNPIPSCLNKQYLEPENTVEKPSVKKKKVKTENENETPKKKKKKRKTSKQTCPEGNKQSAPVDDVAISSELLDNKTRNFCVIEEAGKKDRIESKEFSAGINSTSCTAGEVKQVTPPGETAENSGVQKINLDDLWIDYCDLTEECTKVLMKVHETPDVLYPVPISIEDFNLLKVLGRGSYGKVMLAELKGRRQYYAIKCLKKHVVQEDNDVECTMIEKEVLAMGSNHPYLCTLFCTFQNESHLFFVMEYLSGGDLMFHIQQSGRFNEDRARFYSSEIVCALKYLHKHGIIYRDAKLDNICIDADGHVRLVDFGFCKLRIYRKECLPRNLCGTPDYMAPEIIKGQHYNQSVDWWSFGVLLYEMLTGQSPFNGADEEELFWSVCNEDIFYPRYISEEAKELLALLLNKNPEKRLGMPSCDAGDIYGQSFFHFVDWAKVERKEMEPPFKPKLKSETDVSNFDSDFTMERAVLTPTEREILATVDQEQFAGFSYTNSSMFLQTY